MITNLKLRIFIIIFYIKLIYVLQFASAGFILMVYVLLHSLSITSNLSIYTFFVMEVIYLLILFFNVLINLSGTANFPSLCLITFLYYYPATMTTLIYCKIHFLCLPIFWLVYVL